MVTIMSPGLCLQHRCPITAIITRFRGPTWGPPGADPGGHHVGPMNLAIWVIGQNSGGSQSTGFFIIARFCVPTVMMHGSDITWVINHFFQMAIYWLFNSLFKLPTKKTQVLHYLPFLNVIYRSLLDSPHKGPVIQTVFPCHHIHDMIKGSCGGHPVHHQHQPAC